jgi:hypothetical protein
MMCVCVCVCVRERESVCVYAYKTCREEASTPAVTTTRASPGAPLAACPVCLCVCVRERDRVCVCACGSVGRVAQGQ